MWFIDVPITNPFPAMREVVPLGTTEDKNANAVHMNASSSIQIMQIVVTKRSQIQAVFSSSPVLRHLTPISKLLPEPEGLDGATPRFIPISSAFTFLSFSFLASSIIFRRCASRSGGDFPSPLPDRE